MEADSCFLNFCFIFLLLLCPSLSQQPPSAAPSPDQPPPLSSISVEPTPAPSTSPDPNSSPTESPSPAPSTSLDPKQLSALDSLNISAPDDPCSDTLYSDEPAPCDDSSPFRRLLFLRVANCTHESSLSTAALRTLSTLKQLEFINCQVDPVRFPPELTAGLESFTCISSLRVLTGVWLSRLRNLRELTINNVAIVASGPTIIISNMKSLNSLTISQTSLNGELPRRWNPGLTHIDLSKNQLRGRIPLSLTRLDSLAFLNLSTNTLIGRIPRSFGGLTSLQNLSLSSNNLTGTIPRSLSSITGLVHLDLGSNQLNGTIPSFIAEMKHLRFLNLEKNDFRGVMPFNESFIRRMSEFKIANNTNLCYNTSMVSLRLRLGIAPCDRYGMPIRSPPARESSRDESLDGDYGGDEENNVKEEKKPRRGTNKVALGVSLGLTSVALVAGVFFVRSRCRRSR